MRELIELDVQDRAPGEEIDSEVGYARRFGVSRPTVRKAVEDLIAIGLIKRFAGKGLVLCAAGDIPNRGKLLVMLPHSVGDGFLYRVLMGCVGQANHLGFEYKLLNEDNAVEKLRLFRKERLDEYVGAITCAYNTDEEREILAQLRAAGLPAILVDNPAPETGAPCVTCDDYRGGYLMGQYLAKKGHQRIVNLSSTRPAQTILLRDKGFFDALRDARIVYNPLYYMKAQDPIQAFISEFSAEDIRTGRITAICSHSSLMITRLSQWLYRNKVRVYDDISLIGYGDHPFLPEYGLPITSIEVPSEQLGRSAVDELSQALLQKRAPRDVMLDVWLEKRHTVKTV